MKDFNVHIHKNLHALGKTSKNKFLPRHNIEYSKKALHFNLNQRSKNHKYCYAPSQR